MGRRAFAGVARAPRVALCVVAGLLATSTGATAGSVTNKFKGATLTYIVAAEPRGSYDVYGRLVARYLAKHLGVAKVVFTNLPGEGHITGANAIYAARPDGLTIGTFNPGVTYAQLLGLDGVKFDLRKMSWIGNASDEARLLVVAEKSGYRSLDDLRKSGRALVVGSSGVGASSFNDVRLLAHVFGFEVKNVVGLSTRDAQLAMKRGEIEGQFGSAIAHRPFITAHYGRAVLRVGSGPGVDETIPDADALASTAEGKAAVALVRTQALLLRMTAGPPGIPDDRLLALRAAYMAALEDPGLLAEARKLDIPVAPMDGATLAVRVKEALNQPPAVVGMIAAAGVRSGAPLIKRATQLTAVEDGGRTIRFLANDVETVSTVDPTAALLTLDGKPVAPTELAVGMSCELSYEARPGHAVRVLRCATPP